MVQTPTRSRVEGWSSGHLRQAAMGWQRQADLTEQLYGQARRAVDSASWKGAAADRASAKLFENLVKIRGPDAKPSYASPDTTVVDLNNPSERIGMLPGISQASGVYDPKTNRMVIVGNTGPNAGDRTRMLYTSDPIDPKNPNGWMQTLKPQGVIQGLPGDRENQLVALKGGWFMLMGSNNFNPGVPGDQPVGAITASIPEGLLTAQSTPLFADQGSWPGGAAPYGPTVVDTVYDPVTGVETVQLRVSTWEDPPNWDGTGNKPYNPFTYSTSVSVQH